MKANVWERSKPVPKPVHLIADIRFFHGEPGEDAPMRCTCSWTGLAGDFSAHRKKNGAPDRRSGGALGPSEGELKPMRVVQR